MDNVKNSIWLNTERKDSALIFGLYYEFYNEILYRGMFKFEETFNTFLNNLFINYISNKRNENLDYKTLFNGYIDKLLDSLSLNDKEDIVSKILTIDIKSFKNSVNSNKMIYPYIDIVNNLSLSYQDKTCLMELITNYSNNLFDTLCSFFNDEKSIKIYELIEENIHNCLNDDENINNYKNNFYDNNRLFIDSLVKKGILSFENMDKNDDFNIGIMNTKEKELLFNFFKESLIYEDIEKIDFENLIEKSNMSKLSFYTNTKSLFRKIKRKEKTKKKVK